MVQDYAYLQWTTNRKYYMAYQRAAKAVTLNDLEGNSQAFSNTIRGTFVHSTRFQLRVFSHGSSALAELLNF